MLRRIVEFPGALRPRHHIEIIEIVAMRGGAGVIALGHQRHIAVLHRHRLVERAVIGIDALEGEALGGLKR